MTRGAVVRRFSLFLLSLEDFPRKRQRRVTSRMLKLQEKKPETLTFDRAADICSYLLLSCLKAVIQKSTINLSSIWPRFM